MLSRLSVLRKAFSTQKVLLIRDHLPLGYEGQLVKVKGGQAEGLIRNLVGVPFYPGILNRMYP